VTDHHGVVVHVDDAAVARAGLREGVHRVARRHSAAQVEELPDPLGRQEPDGSFPEGDAGAQRGGQLRERLQGLPAGRPVGGEVVLAAVPEIVHPARVRDVRAKSGAFRSLVVRGCHAR